MAFLSCLWNSRCVYIPEFTFFDELIDHLCFSEDNEARLFNRYFHLPLEEPFSNSSKFAYFLKIHQQKEESISLIKILNRKEHKK
ncbi:hypothetical protein BpHYR1_031615 [Brachionus plicatilis]|uniref:Uncharacterized protein n=1 Tax=Brachionus plicatilis TaxID=10195 RepID=A0A3M7SIJ1_BRAPC|nr:hypothetical protein BpHYR1_031615 [Brachionus plicatilis]